MTWSGAEGAAAATAEWRTAEWHTEEVACQAEALAWASATAPVAARFEDVAARWRATQEQLRYVVEVVDAALALAPTARDDAAEFERPATRGARNVDPRA
jgi:hypothetical protein